MSPADSAARAGDMPEASGDSSSGTLAKNKSFLREQLKMNAFALVICLTGSLVLSSCNSPCRITSQRIPPPAEPIQCFEGEEYSFFFTQMGDLKRETWMVVYSHSNNAWARLVAIPTEGGRFGYVDSATEEAKDMSQIWNDRPLKALERVDPLQPGVPGVRRNGQQFELHYRFNNLYSKKYMHGSTILLLRIDDLDCIFQKQSK